MSSPSITNASGPDATLLGDGATSRVASIERGQRIGRYLLLDLVGQGAMGRVYAAYDPELDRRIALKLVPCSEEHGRRDRFLREAKAMARIDHPHVVSVHDAGIHEDWVWVAMALIDGPPLDEWLASKRSRRELIDVMIGAGRGLEAAHKAGVIHRDFKPGNVLVGAGGVAKVGDFGVAGIDEPTTAAEDGRARTIGTPAYMSPEHIAGVGVEARSDQFSYCIALAEALLGERPFVGDTLPELAGRIVQGRLSPRVVHARGRLGRLLRRGLSRHPDDRFPSMTELLDELDRMRRATWPRWVLALTAIAIVAAAMWLSAGPRASCPSGASRIEAFWDRNAKERVQIGGDAYTPEFVAAARERYVAAVDDYASRWADAFDASCARVGPDALLGTPEERQASACIENRLASLQGLVEFASARPRDAGAMGDLVNALPAIAECGSRAWVAYPADPEEAARAADLRRRIEVLMWARIADTHAAMNDEARVIEREARELGDPYVIALILREVGRMEADAGQNEAADAHFDEALRLALQHGYDRHAAGVINEIVITANERDTESRDVLRLVMLGVAFAERAEAPRAAGSLMLNKANTLRELGDIDGALAALAEAEEYYRRDGEERSIWRVRLTEVVLHMHRGDVDKGLALAQELRERIAEAFAHDAFESVEADRMLVGALMAVGRNTEALEVARGALARVRRTYVHGSHTLHDAAWNNAVVAARTGHLDEARECFALAMHPSARDPGMVAGFEALIELAAGRTDEAAKILDAALAIEPRIRGAILVEIQRAHVYVLTGDLDSARALLSRPTVRAEAAEVLDLAVDYALLGQVCDLPAPDGGTWETYLRAIEPNMHATRWLHAAALGMATASAAEVRAARAELLRTTFEGSPELQLLDLWLRQHAADISHPSR